MRKENESIIKILSILKIAVTVVAMIATLYFIIITPAPRHFKVSLIILGCNLGTEISFLWTVAKTGIQIDRKGKRLLGIERFAIVTILCGMFVIAMVHFHFIFKASMMLLYFVILLALEVLKIRFYQKFISSRTLKISMIIMLFLTVVLVFLLVSSVDSDLKMEKQWYLHNTSDAKAVAGAADYEPGSTPVEGIDIDAERMWRLSDVYGHFDPDDPDTLVGGSSWDLSAAAYKSHPKDVEIVIAIIDSGIDYQHKDILKSMWINRGEAVSNLRNNGIDDDENGYVDDLYGYDFCKRAGEAATYKKADPGTSRGTMCAGIIAAKGKINGVVGEKRVKLMSLKVTEDENQDRAADVKNAIEAIEYAERNGAQICNLNISFQRDAKELEDVMRASKMLFVVPAGDNDAGGIDLDQMPEYPAAYDLENMIVVANLSYDGTLNKHSNYGFRTVDVAAPGTYIYTTDINDSYGYASGTSMAAAVVSGIAVLIYQMTDDADAITVRDVICGSTVGLDGLSGKVSMQGIVNGAEALKLEFNHEYIFKSTRDK